MKQQFGVSVVYEPDRLITCLLKTMKETRTHARTHARTHTHV